MNAASDDERRGGREKSYDSLDQVGHEEKTENEWEKVRDANKSARTRSRSLPPESKPPNLVPVGES